MGLTPHGRAAAGALQHDAEDRYEEQGGGRPAAPRCVRRRRRGRPDGGPAEHDVGERGGEPAETVLRPAERGRQPGGRRPLGGVLAETGGEEVARYGAATADRSGSS
ncbi:hypothetical protein [Actinoallomurus sp. CA-142502]|uniref:hypothetical protein n=1 Tax=Actinoallomurus sp. CA-142502 TaxID=3239885 RepID=UPI003D913344